MKKKFLSIPAILLLLLLFVFHGITYANTYREFTEEEFKNFLYNAWINNHTEQEVENAIQTQETNGNITTIVDLLNEYNYCLLTVNDGVNGWNTIEIGLTPSDKHLYWYNSRPYVKNSDNCFKYVLQYSGTLTKTWGFSYSYSVRTDYIYYGMPRYQASDNNTIIQAGNTMIPSNIFDGPYNQMLFMFTPEQTNTNVNVDIYEDIPAYEYSVGENITIGILYVPNETKITNFSIIRAYYNGNYWKYIEVTTQYQNSYINYNIWNNEEDWKSYEIIFNRQYIQQNNIYIITWSDQTEEPYQNATGIFYIKNGQTVIVNGEIIPSGDNITGTIGELQEDINKNNDFWKETYNNLFTIDSGDAEEIINNFLESSNLGEYGLESGEIAILNVLNGEPSDFIISWNSVIIPNLKDNTPTQLVPAGNINFSKVSVTLGNESYTLSEERLNQFMIIIGWVQLIMGISVVILTIANVWETLMRALGVGVGLYEDNADEHSTIVNVGEDGSMRTTEVVKTPTKSRIWYIHKKY